MAEWRFHRGWSEDELRLRLDDAKDLVREHRPEPHHWRRYHSESLVATEAPGPPVDGGAFARAADEIESYEFSDPRIVRPHFDARVPLLGRRVLLELQVLGLHYLVPVAVGALCDERDDERTRFGYRIDTLPGHIERGSEWFLLEKRHASGTVRFRIEAWWRAGDFPNAWSRAGFTVLAPFYQRAWHRRSQARLARLVRHREVAAGAPAHRGRLASSGTGLDDGRRAL